MVHSRENSCKPTQTHKGRNKWRDGAINYEKGPNMSRPFEVSNSQKSASALSKWAEPSTLNAVTSSSTMYSNCYPQLLPAKC